MPNRLRYSMLCVYLISCMVPLSARLSSNHSIKVDRMYIVWYYSFLKSTPLSLHDQTYKQISVHLNSTCLLIALSSGRHLVYNSDIYSSDGALQFKGVFSCLPQDNRESSLQASPPEMGERDAEYTINYGCLCSKEQAQAVG